MKLAFTTTFDAKDVHNWSGTPFHMSSAMESQVDGIDYIGSLKRQLPKGFKLKQIYKKYITQQRESPRFNTHVAEHYSQQVAKQLQHSKADVILSPLVNPIAYLDCKQPIVLWTDAVYASLLGFYPPFAYHSANTIHQGNSMTQACLDRCQLALFSSEWAANSAIELYGADRNKVKVIPFGANITDYPDFATVSDAIKTRSDKTIKLLFLAKSWERKGGDIVLKVADALYQAGHSIELAIVGIKKSLPERPYVKNYGFISKQTEAGRKQLADLLLHSHFLFVPSRAEAFGCVFAEANAYGLPCLSTHVGGISSAIRDDINGKTFALNANVDEYCNYIANLVGQPQQYMALAKSSYNEFITRLNWQSACSNTKKLIEDYC